MICKNCQKLIDLKKRRSINFCCEKCYKEYYLKTNKYKYNCMFCGKLCTSRRRVCFDCLKLGKNEIKRRYLIN